MAPLPVTDAVIADPSGLVDLLLADGWRVIGPRVRDGAVVYEPLTAAADLPRGVADEQEGGRYRLTEGRAQSWFDYTVGPQGWKRWLFPPRQKLWSAEKSADGFEVHVPPVAWPKTAFLGVRGCELAAIRIQDKVFDNGDFADQGYNARRQGALIVAVNCGRSAATCFCAAMDSGPKAGPGYDLGLTEIIDSAGHRFLIEAGSERGRDLVARLTTRPATDADRKAAAAATQAAAKAQTRTMPKDIAPIVKRSPEHPRWAQVAERCLNCANCTLVCPTCFCSDVVEVGDLTGDHAERWRQWDSCFSIDFSYIHGGAIRRSGLSRYRQWMTHKLSAWHDQFDSSGCTGCGRCIAWCPVGIDITEEAEAIAAGDGKEKPHA